MTTTRRTILKGSAASAALIAAPLVARAQSAIELTVQYPSPNLFQKMHEEMKGRFEAKHPNVRLTFRAPYENYEDGLQKSLRDAITRSQPDVAYHGVNRQRTLLERDIPVDLTPFIKADAEWASLGFADQMLDLGRIGGKQTGIGTALSTPILYVNVDLLAKAGMKPEELTSWEAVIKAAAAMDKPADNIRGYFFDWTITGNWSWQGLVFSHGGQMLTSDESRVAYGDAPGEAAIQLLRRFVDDAKMPDLKPETAFSDFFAGRLGILMQSTAQLARVTREIGGRFALKTVRYPITAANGRIPAGGKVAMMFTKDAAKQKAAFDYIKFVTGPEGATIMVNNTGYMPSTALPGQREDMLAKFYRENPNWNTTLQQLPVMTGWYAFPGQNALKITDVINDHLQTVVNRTKEALPTLKLMTSDVQALLPRRAG
ncbi:MAG: extracellular solute-binding protein [Bosea sp. (in: a-proteobacteria)]